MNAVEMLGVLLVENDEKLAPASVFSCMRHGERAELVLVGIALGLAVDLVAGAPGSNGAFGLFAALRVGVTALDDEVLDHAMELGAVVETGVGELLEIGHSFGRFFLVQLG